MSDSATVTSRPGTAPGLLTFGETMGLVTTDGIGPLEHARQAHISIGGAESNVAVGVARLGQPVTFISRVGRDAVGDLIVQRLRAEGITTEIARDDSYTGIMIRHRRTGGVGAVDYHRTGSAGSALAPADIRDDLISRSALVHVTGITPALSASAHDAVAHTVKMARRRGVPVSIDVNYRSKLWNADRARSVLAALVSAATIVFAGIEEAQLILDTSVADPLTLAGLLNELGPSEVIIKDGARGCTAVIDGERYKEPAIAVTVVDTVGAGDAFVAGYLAERLAGHGALSRLRTAVAVGAFAVTVPGDCELLPTRSELTLLTSDDDVHR